jgi:flagellar motor switch protein FliN/FliY
MSSTFTVGEYAAALVGELSKALESVLGRSVSATAGAAVQGDGWAMTFTAAGELVGTITAWADRAGSALLAQRVTGMDDASEDAVVADMLKEMWSQAASALSLKPPFTRVRLTLEGPVLATAGGTQLAAYAMAFDADATAQIAVSASAQVVEVDAIEPSRVAPPPPPAAAGEMQKSRPPAHASANLDVVLDIDLPLVVRFGRTLMTLKTLAALGPGSILDMGRSPDEPVEILVGEQVIARGEVVIVSGNYGVRITDLVSPADRIRALEA